MLRDLAWIDQPRFRGWGCSHVPRRGLQFSASRNCRRRITQREICQFTAASDFGTIDKSHVPDPPQATQSLPSEFFPSWHDGQVILTWIYNLSDRSVQTAPIFRCHEYFPVWGLIFGFAAYTVIADRIRGGLRLC